jgi:two-component system sensor histidine kinase KdpD
LVQRTIANVIANAVAWSPPDHPVSVRAGAVPGAVMVRVVDHGPGIPAAERERVFRPFQRLGDQPADGTGIGLGLAVARGLAEAVGAELTPEDTPGGGTTMSLALPLATADAEVPVP